jgi:hypothetical protein
MITVRMKDVKMIINKESGGKGRVTVTILGLPCYAPHREGDKRNVSQENWRGYRSRNVQNSK